MNKYVNICLLSTANESNFNIAQTTVRFRTYDILQTTEKTKIRRLILVYSVGAFMAKVSESLSLCLPSCGVDPCLRLNQTFKSENFLGRHAEGRSLYLLWSKCSVSQSFVFQNLTPKEASNCVRKRT